MKDLVLISLLLLRLLEQNFFSAKRISVWFFKRGSIHCEVVLKNEQKIT